jgi:hypothetical protein
MNDVIARAQHEGTRVIKWCVMEVLERCPAERDCAACELFADCNGVAKTACSGFVSLEDVLKIKRRVSQEAWECEVMCRRPSVKGRVFPNFDRAVHVWEGERHEGTEARRHEGEEGRSGEGELRLAIDFGFANPFVCLWIVMGADGVTRVVDEYVQPGRTVLEHAEEIERRESSGPAARWGRARVIACDPAGAGRNEQTAESNIALLKRRGFNVRHRGSQIQDGLERIRHALKPALGPATLVVSSRCERLIKALEGYHYAETGGSELPVKDGEHDHLIDALRYHFVNAAGTAARGPVRY